MCFILFEIEYIPQDMLKKIKTKSITYKRFRIKFHDYFMCGFYCIAFEEYTVTGKTLLE